MFEQIGGSRIWLVAALLALTACGGGGSGSNQNFQNFKTGTIRFIHAVPDSVALDIAIEQTAFTRVGFGNASPRTPITARKLRIDVGYADSTGARQLLIQKSHVTVREDEDLSVYLTGPFSTPVVLSVQSEPPVLTAGRAEISFVHVATSRNDIQVFLTAPTTDITSATPNATLSLRQSTTPSDVAAGNYRLRLRASGSNTVLFDSGTFTITDQARNAFAIVDYFGPGTSTVRALRIDNVGASVFPAEAFPVGVRVANLAADTLEVDVTLNNGATTSAINDVPFPGVAGNFTGPAASYATTVIADNIPSAVVFSGTQSLQPAEQRTLVTLGTFTGGYQSRFITDMVRPIAGEASLRIIHGAPVAAAVDYYLVPVGADIATRLPTFTALPLLTSAEMLTAPGSYNVIFTTPATKTVVAGPLSITVAARSLNTLYSHDAIGGGAPAGLIISQVAP